MSKNGEHFKFPVADGPVKLSGGNQEIQESTTVRDHLAREEHNDVLQGECGDPRGNSDW